MLKHCKWSEFVRVWLLLIDKAQFLSTYNWIRYVITTDVLWMSHQGELEMRTNGFKINWSKTLRLSNIRTKNTHTSPTRLYQLKHKISLGKCFLSNEKRHLCRDLILSRAKKKTEGNVCGCVNLYQKSIVAFNECCETFWESKWKCSRTCCAHERIKTCNFERRKEGKSLDFTLNSTVSSRAQRANWW